MLSLLIGIILFVILCLLWQQYQNQQNGEDNNGAVIVTRNLSLLIPIFFCVGSTALSLSFHIPNILIAWSTDPAYASKVSIYYGILIFSLFISCKYAYSVPITLRRMVTGGPQRSDVALVGTTITATVIMVAALHIVAVYFYTHIPVNNAIEGSVTGIYQSTTVQYF